MAATLKAPFPYFGGKSRVASLVWERLGDVKNYIEPFCGSAAMLLGRPHSPKLEILNDANCHIANFWRSVQADPDGVVTHCDQPVNEADLHAWHRYLVVSEAAALFRQRVAQDKDFYDAEVAGRWVWGASAWIGRGWCADAANPVLWQQMPCIDNTGIHSGVRLPAARPDVVGIGAISSGLGNTNEQRRQSLLLWFQSLRDRLRMAKVCCGDWKRVCSSFSTTTRNGLTGVFLDPPYLGEVNGKTSRASSLYAVEDLHVAHDVREWCITREDDPLMRIALCGYDGEHNDLEQRGWSVVAWKNNCGYSGKAGRSTNADRERIWFSPHCLKPSGDTSLFIEPV